MCLSLLPQPLEQWRRAYFCWDYSNFSNSLRCLGVYLSADKQYNHTWGKLQLNDGPLVYCKVSSVLLTPNATNFDESRIFSHKDFSHRNFSPFFFQVSKFIYSFVGAGLVATLGIGIYRYLNH